MDLFVKLEGKRIRERALEMSRQIRKNTLGDSKIDDLAKQQAEDV